MTRIQAHERGGWGQEAMKVAKLLSLSISRTKAATAYAEVRNGREDAAPQE